MKLVIVAAIVLVVAGAGIALATRPTAAADTDAGYSGSLMPEQVPISNFTLKDETGKPISLLQFKGSPLVLTFMYTHCKDLCPLTTQQIRGAMDQLGHDVPVVSVTADPHGDTPASVKTWLAAEQMTGRMRWALGSSLEVPDVWKAYGVAGQTAKMDHSSYVFILDREGRRCVSWPTSQLTPEGLAHDLRLIESRNGICRG